MGCGESELAGEVVHFVGVGTRDDRGSDEEERLRVCGGW